jgi:prophage regulatory protein
MSKQMILNRPITSRLIRKPEIKERFGIPNSTLYDAIKAKQFPAPVKLSARSVGWLEEEVNAWLEARIAASRKA